MDGKSTMSENYSCPKHGSFPTKELLKEHMLSTHGVKFENEPTIEFSEQVKRIEEKQLEKPVPLAVQPQPIAGPLPIVRKPLKLEYIWTGNCEFCSGTNIKTIILKTNRTNIAVCYCLNCSKDIAQKIIKPLEEKEVKNGNSSVTPHISKSTKMRKVRETAEVHV